MVNQGLSLEERFWMKVDKRGEDECWLWTASLQNGGYGQIALNGRPISAHRYSYERIYGIIPEGLFVWHDCPKHACVNPNHLYAATHRSSTEERFWAQVKKRGEDECWEWSGTRDNGNDYNYGHIREQGTNRYIGAHRYSYELHKGPIPEGELVRHKCHNPPCVNPNHLETGTHKDNSQDAVRADRIAYGERVGISKLKESQVRDIRALLARGESTRGLAKMFSIDRSVIRDIGRGKIWRRVKLDE